MNDPIAAWRITPTSGRSDWGDLAAAFARPIAPGSLARLLGDPFKEARP